MSAFHLNAMSRFDNATQMIPEFFHLIRCQSLHASGIKEKKRLDINLNILSPIDKLCIRKMCLLPKDNVECIDIKCISFNENSYDMSINKNFRIRTRNRIRRQTHDSGDSLS